ncbi:MAG: hypothetical protein ACI4TK_15735 [Agathobacter sp.]
MVDFTEIRDILKVGNFYYDLFKEENINPWSWNKPMDYDKIQRLTDDEKKSINYGWDVKIYNSISELITDIENENMWKYLVPTNMLRISDFELYNPDSKKPFQLYFKNANYGKVGDTISFGIDDFTQVFTWGVMSGESYANWNVGLIVAKDLTSKNIYYYNVSSVQDLNTESIDFIIPSFFNTGEYKCFLVLTDFSFGSEYINVEDNSYRWFSFPCVPLKLTVSETPQFNPWQYFNINIIESSYDQSGLLFSNIHFVVEQSMDVDFSGNVNIVIDFLVKDTLYGSISRDVTIGSTSHDFNGGDSYNDEINYEDVIELIAMDDNFFVTANVTIQSGTFLETREYKLYL